MPRSRGFTRREFNPLPLIWLATVAVVLAVGVRWLHSSQVVKAAARMLDRGNEAFEAKEWEDAIRCYEYYINYEPEDLEIRVRLAKLLADRAKASGYAAVPVSQAYQFVADAARRQPDDMELLRLLADLQLENGDYNAATANFDRLLKANPKDPDLLFRIGCCYKATGDVRKAMETLRGAIAGNPKNIDAYVLLSRIFLDKKVWQPKEAANVIEQMVLANPDATKARLERAQFYYDQKDQERTGTELDAVLAKEPNNFIALVMAAELAIQRNQLDRAQELANRAKALQPNSEELNSAMVKLKLKQGAVDEAASLIDRLLERWEQTHMRTTDLQKQLMHLAEIQSRKQDLLGLRATIKKMTKAQVSRAVVEYFEAENLVGEERYQEAAELLTRLRKQPITRPFDITNPVLRLLGYCCAKLGDVDHQLEIFSRLSKAEPENAQYRFLLAPALYAKDAKKQAFEEYSWLLQRLGLEQFVQYKHCRQNYYYLLLDKVAALPAGERNWTFLENYLSRMQGVPDSDPIDLVLMQASLVRYQGHSDQATRILEDAQKKFPQDGRLWNAIVFVTSTDDPAKAKQMLEPGAGPSADRLEIRVARARLAMTLGTEEASRILRPLEEDVGHFSEAERATLWRELGLCYLKLGSRDNAFRLWEKAGKGNPQDRDPWFLYFETARESNDETRMMQAVEGLRASSGSSTMEFLFCQAALMIWRVKNQEAELRFLDSAAKLIRQALSLPSLETPGQPAIRPAKWRPLICLQAELAVLQNRMDDAIEDYKRAAALGPLPPASLAQYVQLLYVRGRYEDARKYIDRLSVTSSSQSLKMIGSELEMRAGNPDASLQLAAKTIEKSTNPVEYIWYGRLLSKAKKAEEAEKAFRSATRMGVQLPEAWLSLVKQLGADGKRAEAEDELQLAQAFLSEDRASFTAAQAYEAIGEPNRAGELYRTAMMVRSNDFEALRKSAEFLAKNPKQGNVEVCLTQLIEAGRGQVSARSVVAWARRTLASVYADKKDYASQEKAIALIDENLADTKSADEDLRLKVSILGEQPFRASRLKAIAILERIRKEDPRRLKSADQMRLATLYERTGQWSRANTEIQQVLRDEPSNVDFLASGVEMMLRNNVPLANVRPLLDRLESLAPKARRVLLAKAEWLSRQRKNTEAAAAVAMILPLAAAAEKPKELLALAGDLEDHQTFDLAQEYLRTYAKQGWAGKLALAGFLARRGQYSEARLQCDAAASENAPFHERLTVAVDLYRRAPSRIRLELNAWLTGIFDKASKAERESKECQLQAAALADIQEKTSEAFDAYQRLSRRSDLSEVEKASVDARLAYYLAVRKERIDEAVEHIDGAIAVLGPSLPLRETQGLAFLVAKRAEEAVGVFESCVEEAPSGLDYFHLALAKLAADDAKAAQRSFQTAQRTYQFKVESVPGPERPFYNDLVKALGAAPAAPGPPKNPAPGASQDHGKDL